MLVADSENRAEPTALIGPPFAAFGSMAARQLLSAYRSCNDRWLTLLTLVGVGAGRKRARPAAEEVSYGRS